MSTTEVQNTWHQLKEALQTRYEILSDSDLIYKVDKELELLNRIKDRLGLSLNEVKKIIQQL